MSITEAMAQAQPCPDPECGGWGEPEQDGEHIFVECNTCGYQFGFIKQAQPTVTSDANGACAMGIPEAVRRAASAGMEEAMARTEPMPLATPVALGRKHASS